MVAKGARVSAEKLVALWHFLVGDERDDETRIAELRLWI